MGTETERDFRVVMLHNPNLNVPDLGRAERWLEDVFGCPSRSVTEILEQVREVRPDWPQHYSIYTSIRDVFFCCVDPSRFVTDGERLFEKLDQPHLIDLTWSVDGLTESFRRLRRMGYRITNSLGEVQEGDEPLGPNDPVAYSTAAAETGLRLHFYPAGAFRADPRSAPDWTLPPVSDADPLGIERCSHHTFLTNQPERALRLFAAALGGEVIHEARNELLGATCTYIHLGGATIELAVPDDGTAAQADWELRAPDDTYHALTWKVVDLERAERHLEKHGVRIRARSEATFVTDPTTSLGVPWGFSTALVSGDPRAR